jgi:hypothetical protein
MSPAASTSFYCVRLSRFVLEEQFKEYFEDDNKYGRAVSSRTSFWRQT